MRFMLIFCLVSLPAFAGIRITHGGGGYAEMRALSFLDRLERYTGSCLLKPEMCGLSLTQLQFLSDAAKDGSFSTKGARLEFFRPNPTDPGQVFLPSASLYLSKDEPRSLPEIGARVFAAWLGRPALRGLAARYRMSEAEFLRLGEQLYSVLEIQEERLALADYALNAATLFSRITQKSEVVLSAETTEAAVDLTAGILTQLPCAPSFSRRLVRLQGLHTDGGVAVARATWACGDNHFAGRMMLKFDSQAGAAKVVFASVTPAACGSNLESSK